jgi:chromosome segregation ATPase
MLGGVDSDPGPPSGRRREIDDRLDAVRARLQKLRERDWDAVKSQTAARGERLEAAQRHAAEAHAAAAKMLASSADAFRRAAEAHERVASVHERAAASGIGDVHMRKRQAALHRAAAAADRQRADRVLSLLSQPGRTGPGAVPDEPRDGGAP